MPVQYCAGDGVSTQHLAFPGAGSCACGEAKHAFEVEVFTPQPAVGFVRVGSPRPAQQLVTDDTVRGPEGFGRTDVSVIIGPSSNNRVERLYQRFGLLSQHAFDALAG